MRATPHLDLSGRVMIVLEPDGPSDQSILEAFNTQIHNPELRLWNHNTGWKCPGGISNVTIGTVKRPPLPAPPPPPEPYEVTT